MKSTSYISLLTRLKYGLLALALTPLESVYASDYYTNCTPMFFSDESNKSPLTVHAAYYDKNSGGVSWTVLTTFEEGGFITFKPKSELNQKSDKYTTPTCELRTYRFNEENKYNRHGIDTGHGSLSVANMGHFLINDWYNDKFRVYASPKSAIFQLQCLRVGQDYVGPSIENFFEKMAKGLTVFYPEETQFIDWTSDFREVTPYLQRCEHEHRLWLPQSPYVENFK